MVEANVEARSLRTRKPVEETLEKPQKNVIKESKSIKKETKLAPKSKKKIVEKQEESKEEKVVKSKPKSKKKLTESKQNGSSKEENEAVEEQELPTQDEVVKSKPKSRKKAAVSKKENESSDKTEKETEPEVEKKEKRLRKKIKPEIAENESDVPAQKSKKKAVVKPTNVKKAKAVVTKEKKAKIVKPKSDKVDTPPNRTSTEWDEIDFSTKRQTSNGNDPNFKITSWNVDGLRAWVNKDCLKILQYDKPDILCLQETKCANDKIPKEVQEIEGYKMYWNPSKSSGYAGVALFSKEEPITLQLGIGVEEYDEEGRCITAEFEKFYVICVYVPNAGKSIRVCFRDKSYFIAFFVLGRQLVSLPKRLKWNEEFKKFVKQLDEKKPVIICGDMNVAHNEIDLKNPSTNKNNAGFTQEERDGMTDFLESGFVDSFRKLYPDEKDVYTFWSFMNKARSKNVGW